MRFRGPAGPKGQRRNYAQNTIRAYVRIVRDFAKHFQQSPDKLGPQHLRRYQAYLFQEKKLDAGTVQQHVAALRFFYVKTLKRRYLLEEIPMPKRRRKLPKVLGPEEVEQLIDSASNLFHRTMLMTLYSTGMRCAELCRLQVIDIDSLRMVVHIRQGKGGHDRDVRLSDKLLETLRVYWRWMKPKNYLFPGTVKNWRADVPVTPKIVWHACREAAKRAGINKEVHPHTLRLARSRSGSARHPGAARPCKTRTHGRLPACFAKTPDGGREPPGYAQPFQSGQRETLAEETEAVL
jgi:integrase/recombinase XerD